MPYLIVQTDDRIQAGRLTGRVLIGRKPINMIVIDHDAVSRIHAWIEWRDGCWVVGDCGGRNGTYVNGHRIDRLTPLVDGDEIYIGRTSITFTEREAPANAEPLDLGDLDGRLHGDSSGFLAWCACGAPMWVPNFLGGCTRPCGHCKQPMQLPPAPVSATKRPAAPLAVCTICQCGIDADTAHTTCPDCGLSYHTECWEENLGCSTYGCQQVNALAPEPQPAAAVDEAPVELAGEDARTPHAYLYLAASVAATVLGALTFGTPALIVLLAATLYLLRQPPQRGVVLASVLVSLLGVAAGLVLSYHWWIG